MITVEFYNKVHSKADGKFAETPGPGHAKGAPKATPKQAAALKKVLAKPKTKAGSVVISAVAEKAKVKPASKPAVKKVTQAATPKSSVDSPAKAPAIDKAAEKARVKRLIRDDDPFGNPASFNESPPPKGVVPSKLSDQGLTAALTYRGEAFVDVTSLLRKGKSDEAFITSSQAQKIVNDLDEVFRDAQRTTEDIVVMRSISKSMKMGKKFVDKAFVSTTYEKQVAEEFGYQSYDESKIIRIVIPKGTRVLKMSGYNPKDARGGEAEILLNRGSTFELQADGSFRLVET